MQRLSPSCPSGCGSDPEAARETPAACRCGRPAPEVGACSRWDGAAVPARSTRSGPAWVPGSHAPFRDELDDAVLAIVGTVIQPRDFQAIHRDVARRNLAMRLLSAPAEAVRLRRNIGGVHPRHTRNVHRFRNQLAEEHRLAEAETIRMKESAAAARQIAVAEN